MGNNMKFYQTYGKIADKFQTASQHWQDLSCSQKNKVPQMAENIRKSIKQNFFLAHSEPPTPSPSDPHIIKNIVQKMLGQKRYCVQKNFGKKCWDQKM